MKGIKKLLTGIFAATLAMTMNVTALAAVIIRIILFKFTCIKVQFLINEVDGIGDPLGGFKIRLKHLELRFFPDPADQGITTAFG